VRWWRSPAFPPLKLFSFIKVSRNYVCMKIALFFFLLITHRCGTLASWATQHTTMCLDVIDKSIQKSFISNLPGIHEHIYSLPAILQDATSKKPLIITFLDLNNAFSLIPCTSVNIWHVYISQSTIFSFRLHWIILFKVVCYCYY